MNGKDRIIQAIIGMKVFIYLFLSHSLCVKRSDDQSESLNAIEASTMLPGTRSLSLALSVCLSVSLSLSLLSAGDLWGRGHSKIGLASVAPIPMTLTAQFLARYGHTSTLTYGYHGWFSQYQPRPHSSEEDKIKI